jgi:hypothetical protein
MPAPPDLAALLGDRARIGELTAETASLALAEIAAEQACLSALQTAVVAHLVTVQNGREQDRLLSAGEAAARLGVTKDWLRRRPHLPFVVKLSDGVVRYSSVGIDRFIARPPGQIALTEVRPLAYSPRMPVSRKPGDRKTTIWIPRRLHRAAKLRAARDGTSIRRVILDAVAVYLDQPREEDRR